MSLAKTKHKPNIKPKAISALSAASAARSGAPSAALWWPRYLPGSYAAPRLLGRRLGGKIGLGSRRGRRRGCGLGGGRFTHGAFGNRIGRRLRLGHRIHGGKTADRALQVVCLL